MRRLKTVWVAVLLGLLLPVFVGACNNPQTLSSTPGDFALCAYFSQVNGLITVNDGEGKQGVLLAGASDEQLVLLATSAHGLFVTYGGAGAKAAVLARCEQIGAL